MSNQNCILVSAIIFGLLFSTVIVRKDAHTVRRQMQTPPTQTTQESDREEGMPVKVVRLAAMQDPPEKESSPPQPQKTPPQKTDSSGKGQSSRSNGSIQVVGSFECGMDYYLRTMRAYGAMTVIFDQQGKRFFELGRTGLVTPLDKLSDGYSPVSRRITDDYPEGRRLLDEMYISHGPGRYEILLLLPNEIANRLKDEITSLIGARQNATKAITVFVQYHQASGNKLKVFVEKLSSKGNSHHIGKYFIL